MRIEPIADADSVRLVAKLQAFAAWWAPDWFPSAADDDRRADLPPALEWAIRFPPDFFSLGAFVADPLHDADTGHLRCFRSYGEPCDGFITDRSDNPVIRFLTEDASFEPTRLNDFVVGTVIQWCVDSANPEERPVVNGFDALCIDTNLLWDAPYAVGRIRAWESENLLVVESPNGDRTALRREEPSSVASR